MNTSQINPEATTTSQALWSALLPFDQPDRFQFNLWLIHGAEIVHYAIQQVAIKRLKLNGQMDAQYAIRLVGAICRSVARQRQHNARMAVR